jgi:hypothetical protein
MLRLAIQTAFSYRLLWLSLVCPAEGAGETSSRGLLSEDEEEPVKESFCCLGGIVGVDRRAFGGVRGEKEALTFN